MNRTMPSIVLQSSVLFHCCWAFLLVIFARNSSSLVANVGGLKGLPVTKRSVYHQTATKLYYFDNNKNNNNSVWSNVRQNNNMAKFYSNTTTSSSANWKSAMTAALGALGGKKQQNRLSTSTAVSELMEADERPYLVTDEHRLMIKLFTHYDRLSRPVRNTADTVLIKMSLTITQIFELDERNQVLITNVWANFEWRDEYLEWTPSEFANMRMVRMLSSKLWLPDIVLYNNAADFSPTQLSTRAMVSSDGTVFWSVPNKLFSSCKIDVTYFPFDEQICRMKFGSWTWDGFKLDLMNSSTTADLSFYVNSGEWDLISATQRRHVVIYTCCVEPYPDVTYYALYYFINVFTPCFLMSSLNLLVFLLPADSGEKCGLGITIMLSFAMLMLSVIEKLPETSESFPLISIYLTAVLSMTAVSICCTVFLLTFNYRTSRSSQVPRLILRLLNRFGAFCCVHDDRDGPQSWTDSEHVKTIRMSPSKFIKELAFEFMDMSKRAGRPYCCYDDLISSEVFQYNFAIGVNRIVSRHLEDEEFNAANADWRRLAQYVDRSLFWLLLVVMSSFSVWILVFHAPAQQLLEGAE